MKTPKEWMDWLACETNDPQQKGRTHEVLITEEAISTIQQDAFESGWKRGMEDAMDMQSKGVDPNRAIDAWRSTPNPLKSPPL